MDDVADMNVKSSTDLPLESRVAMLNADQRRIFDNVKSHLLHQQQHEEKKCHCSDLKPLRMFVSGVGGTGKSFLIEAILIVYGVAVQLMKLFVLFNSESYRPVCLR